MNARNHARLPSSASLTPGSEDPTHSGEAQDTSPYRRTAKIADPDKFTDGKAPMFSVWKAALKRKFVGNREPALPYRGF
jgi:hypothetical protein